MATLTKITGENFLRLKAVEIPTDGKTTVIGGKNEQGKSSVLRIVKCLLAGKGASPPVPLRRGAKRGKIAADISDAFDAGDLHFERSVTANGLGALKITSADGSVPSGGPQALADKLRASLMFDPLQFDVMARGTPEQLRKASAMLCDLVGLDLSAERAEADKLKAERLEVGREAKRLKALAEKLPWHDGAPVAEASATDLTSEFSRRLEINRANHDARAKLKTMREEGRRLAVRVESMRAELVKAEKELDERRIEAKAQAELVAGLVDEDPAEMAAKIEAIDALNAMARDNAAKRKAAVEAKIKEDEHAALDAAVVANREAIAAKIADAEYPIDGLSVTEDAVLLDGLPWEQACRSRRIAASVAIGFAQHPELRLLIIEDGANLDGEHLELVAKIASDHGGMALIEVVGDSGATVIIEDGEVRDDNA